MTAVVMFLHGFEFVVVPVFRPGFVGMQGIAHWLRP